MFRPLILRFFVVALVTVFSFSVARVEAGDSEMSHFLPKLSGVWKDMAGNTVLDISNGYLNGCRIVDCFDPAGGGGFGGVTVRIEESSGLRDLRLSFMISNKKTDYIELVDNNSMRLHKYMDFYKESLDGIHLGSTEEEVLRLWGKGRKGNYKYAYGEGVYYPGREVVLYFRNGFVENIVLLKKSRLSFVVTGINARNIGRDVAGRRVEPIENYAEYFWYDSSREYVALNNYPS